MSVITYEGRIEHGQIRLKDAVALPEGAQVYVVVAKPPAASNDAWVQELDAIFAPAREEAGQYSEQEVNADVDAAVTAVRGKRA